MDARQNIDPFSLRALMLQPSAGNGYPLSHATGFVVRRGDAPFLVTTLHVVSGRHPDTGEKLAPMQPPPDLVRIIHHASEEIRTAHGVWTVREERLVDDSVAPLWHEHPEKDRREMPYPETYDDLVADVAVVPLKVAADVELYDVNLTNSEPDILIRPGLQLSVVGFPYGTGTGGYFPIWKTGHVASDYDDSVNERYFLIDASTRSGMSGSPVVFRPLGPYLKKSGEMSVADGNMSIFMGIYSGRIRDDSDIGIVWRPKIVAEVLDHALKEMNRPSKAE